MKIVPIDFICEGMPSGCEITLPFYGFRQNIAYNGILFILFSNPKFFADTRMEY